MEVKRKLPTSPSKKQRIQIFSVLESKYLTSLALVCVLEAILKVIAPLRVY